MRIEIGTGSRSFHISIPRWLTGKPALMRFVLNHCSTDLGGLSPKSLDRLCKELAALGKNHPGWVLVEVESADGETVKITL